VPLGRGLVLAVAGDGGRLPSPAAYVHDHDAKDDQERASAEGNADHDVGVRHSSAAYASNSTCR
jgi:hypothetical protein